MSDSVTLLTLRTRLREVADIGADTTSGRYPTARCNRELNVSWRRFREKSVLAGNGMQWLKSQTGTLTTGLVDAFSSFGVLPMPADCVHVAGFDVVFSAQDIRPLELVSWQDRNQFFDLTGSSVDRPVGFCPFNIGAEVGAAITAGSIAIFPAPDKAYSYKLYYLPTWVERSSDTDLFDVINGFDWAVYDAAQTILGADNDSSGAMQMIMQKKADMEPLFTKRANTQARVGPGRRRNVREQSRRNQLRSTWRLP